MSHKLQHHSSDLRHHLFSLFLFQCVCVFILIPFLCFFCNKRFLYSLFSTQLSEKDRFFHVDGPNSSDFSFYSELKLKFIPLPTGLPMIWLSTYSPSSFPQALPSLTHSSHTGYSSSNISDTLWHHGHHPFCSECIPLCYLSDSATSFRILYRCLHFREAFSEVHIPRGW